MKYYNIDAFTDSLFGRNLADLVLLGRDKFPADKLMQQIAAKMRSWETAFVQKSSPHEFTIRYFTPIVEVPLCGYATIAILGAMYRQRVEKYSEPLRIDKKEVL